MEPAPTFRAAYAKHVLAEYLKASSKDLHGQFGSVLEGFGKDIRQIIPHVDPDLQMPICIVGAGPTGLATALMLNHIGFGNITILEASGRVGGRVYTYEFPADASCPHNYYDVGAMRIPKIATQTSTFKMIDYLKKSGEDVILADYTYSAGTEPTWHEFDGDNSDFHNYMANLLYRNGFPVDKPAHSTYEQPVVAKTFDEALQDFMAGESKPDRWSTRGWLMKGPSEGGAPSWDYKRVEIAETFNTSTGLFDQAFMETICDWFDFNDASKKKAPWYRVEGGMSRLTDAMCKLAIDRGTSIFVNAPVTAMAANQNKITTTYAGNPKPYAGTSSQPPKGEYEAVFTTTTFGCLQRMDLHGLQLSPDNYCGIRALAYDRATKVAIKFKKGWWRDRVRKGGVSSTDMPISNVVYPSWDDGDGSNYTIIVSYSWAQDATRMAALMGANDQESTNSKDPVIQLCFRNLAKLWGDKPSAEELESMYLAHHGFAWSHDPYTAGAFALFGPGQFEFLYPQFTRPLCDNRLSICGEAVSAHHAWISGAFDSAYNAVYTWCTANGYETEAQKLKDSPFALGMGKNTAELDEKLVDVHLGLALLKEQQAGNLAANRKPL